MIQWLGHHSSTAGSVGSISGWGTKTPKAMRCGKKKVGMITLTWDFPGHPVVETYPSSSGGVGSIPGQGTRIPDALWPKSQITKQKQYCNKFSRDFLKISFFSH